MKSTKVLLAALLATTACSTIVSSQNVNDCSFGETGEDVLTCSIRMDASRFSRESWKTGTGGTSTWLGGPVVDAKQSPDGGYGFISTSDMLHSLQRPKKAWMTTSPTNTTGALGMCLQFSYSIGGLGVEALEILLLTFKNVDLEEAISNTSVPLDYHVMPLWRTKQTTHGKWQEAGVTFSTLSQHSVVFSASPDPRYAKYHGFVAVDDITFTEGPCHNDCMFDLGLCSWTNSDSDNFDWKIGRSSEKRGTGPSRDQASSLNTRITTGGYAYVDSSYPRQPGDVAWLVSATIKSTKDPLCLRFWLNMHGGGMGNFRVLRMAVNGSSETQELWRLWEGTSWGTDTWYPCQQTVAFPEEFQIIFEASVGIPGAGDVGLDTISFTQGACPNLCNMVAKSFKCEEKSAKNINQQIHTSDNS